MHSYGAQFCEVRVNASTGETRISRFLGSFDCGRILNAKLAASQFRGGIIMGLGLALMEETQFDERKGRIMNPSLAEYHIPVHMDLPERDVIWTDIPGSARAHGPPTASERSASPGLLRRSRTRSTTPPACACASCRSRWTSCWQPGTKSSFQNEGSSIGRDGRCAARTQGAAIVVLLLRLRTPSARRPARPSDSRLRFETSSKARIHRRERRVPDPALTILGVRSRRRSGS